MAIILYAVTKDDVFCKKESIDGHIDDLSWMRIPTDRRLFRELTTLYPEQPLIAGYKTVRTLPPLKHRRIISISSDSTRGMRLDQALQRFPEGIVIGGASVIKSTMKFTHREYINSILTVRLPLRMPADVIDDCVKDPLLPFKDSGVLKLTSQFYIHTENYEQPTVLLEIWRPTYAG